MRFLVLVCAVLGLNSFSFAQTIVSAKESSSDRQATGQPSAAVVALPFTATFQGTGSGTIGLSSFASAPFTITAIGNTVNRRTVASDVLDIPMDQATIDIAGIGHATFLIPTRVFRTSFGGSIGGAVGFSRDSGGQLDILNVIEPGLQTWDMTTSIGPIFESSPGATNQANMLSTSLGQLDFTSIPSVTLTVVVPEPFGSTVSVVLLALSWRRRSSLATM